MPSSRHARMTRIAISPRFATRTFLKSLLFIPSRVRVFSSRYREEGLVGRDDLAVPDVDVAHLARHRCDDVVLHLHRLEDGDDITELHAVTWLDGHLDDEPLHWRGHRSFADLRRRGRVAAR